MKKLILTSAAIIAFGATAVQAQMQDDMSSDDMETQDDAAMQNDSMPMQQSPTMTPQQMTIYNGLTADQKVQFDGWDLQQKGLYFALSAEQRSQLWALPMAQRQQAWMQIRKAAGLPATPAMNNSGGAMAQDNMATGAMAKDSMATGTQKMANSGARTAPPAAAMNKDYPKCSRTVTDNCMNPGGK